MSKKRTLGLAVLAWYFIAYNTGGVAQIGPFATQAACSNYAASLFAGGNGNFQTTAFFSSSAKQ